MDIPQILAIMFLAAWALCSTIRLNSWFLESVMESIVYGALQAAGILIGLAALVLVVGVALFGTP